MLTLSSSSTLLRLGVPGQSSSMSSWEQQQCLLSPPRSVSHHLLPSTCLQVCLSHCLRLARAPHGHLWLSLSLSLVPGVFSHCPVQPPQVGLKPYPPPGSRAHSGMPTSGIPPSLHLCWRPRQAPAVFCVCRSGL